MRANWSLFASAKTNLGRYCFRLRCVSHKLHELISTGQNHVGFCVMVLAVFCCPDFYGAAIEGTDTHAVPIDRVMNTVIMSIGSQKHLPARASEHSISQ